MIDTMLSKLTLENMNAGFAQLQVKSNRNEEITETTQHSVVRIEDRMAKQEGMVVSFGMSVPRPIYTMARNARASWEQLANMLRQVW
jgi:hypothetical protein